MKKNQIFFVAKGVFFLLLLFAVLGIFYFKAALQRRLWPESFVCSGVTIFALYHAVLLLYPLATKSSAREVLSLIAMDIMSCVLYLYAPFILWRAITLRQFIAVLEFIIIWLGIRFVFLPFIQQIFFTKK